MHPLVMQTENERTNIGAPNRNRTCDLLDRNQTLYPLSYGRTLRVILLSWSHFFNKLDSGRFHADLMPFQ